MWSGTDPYYYLNVSRSGGLSMTVMKRPEPIKCGTREICADEIDSFEAMSARRQP